MMYKSQFRKMTGFVVQGHILYVCVCVYIQWGGGIIWSPADFVRLPTDKEMISL